MKNRLDNKVPAEVNAEHRRLTRVTIKALRILYWSCACCWTSTTYEVMSEALEASFKVAHFDLHLGRALDLHRL